MNRKEKFKTVMYLFASFFRIGAFTFGGGYAMIPLIQTEVVEKKKWITDKDILDIIAISESTPGPISINAATFIGYKICGFWVYSWNRPDCSKTDSYIANACS